jgi:hypothetical protein
MRTKGTLQRPVTSCSLHRRRTPLTLHAHIEQCIRTTRLPVSHVVACPQLLQAAYLGGWVVALPADLRGTREHGRGSSRSASSLFILRGDLNWVQGGANSVYSYVSRMEFTDHILRPCGNQTPNQEEKCCMSEICTRPCCRWRGAVVWLLSCRGRAVMLIAEDDNLHRIVCKLGHRHAF